ncbi:hypothetical protein RUM44_003943 [Polyplax serrata]|uniref:Carbohydrate kinase PfkB domain-containing protein n=1 Tax=Polyplax serrata TaxID=468196 RepID=A0ABR1B1F0_POLSC
MDGRTFKGKIAQAGGGVGRNIADALGKLGTSPFLISAVGNDEFGNFIMTQTIPHLNPNGISRLRDVNTGTCMVLCDHTGECLFVVGDMDIHERITEDQIKRFEKTIAESSLVVLDGNLSQQTLEFVLILCQKHSVPGK